MLYGGCERCKQKFCTKQARFNNNTYEKGRSLATWRHPHRNMHPQDSKKTKIPIIPVSRRLLLPPPALKLPYDK